MSQSSFTHVGPALAPYIPIDFDLVLPKSTTYTRIILLSRLSPQDLGRGKL